jgi:hypothetical protein
MSDALFFDRGQRVAKPSRLRSCVGSRQLLSGALNREPQGVQQAGNVVIVVAHTEPSVNQVADHRTGPHSSRIPRRLWPSLDDL